VVILKIVLINPIFEHVSSVLPPMGLLYIGAVLEKNSFDVKLIDANVYKMDNETIVKKTADEEPDIIGLTISTPMLVNVVSLTRMLKDECSESKIVFGGPHPSAMPEESLNAGADVVVIGEGEETCLDICKKPDNKNIPGTAVFQNKKIYINKPRTPIKNLDSLPFPARHLIDVNDYFTVGAVKKPFTTILTSRGCPGTCIYCNKTIFGRQFRARNPENVVREIEFLIEQYNIKELDILDDTFTLDMKRAEKICDMIVERNIDVSWRCSNGIRVDCVSETLLTKMKKAGCHQVSFGVESGDNKVLKQIGKGITTEQIRDAFSIAKKIGLETVGFFMLGLPFDTKTSMQKTIDFSLELDPDYAQFTMTMPLPATPLYNWFSKRYGELDWRKVDFFDGRAVFETENFTKRDVDKFYNTAYRKFYYRPSYIFKNILKLRSIDDLKTKLIGLKNVITLSRL
jgi:radical SAM superfamily enzyme YgiQ (UPF0313 family)